MSIDEFRLQVRQLMEQLLNETEKADREQVLDAYTEEVVRLHGQASHQLLNELLEDARTRLDARLSPDPIRQTIASVTTTVQDVWRSFWNP